MISVRKWLGWLWTGVQPGDGLSIGLVGGISEWEGWQDSGLMQ